MSKIAFILLTHKDPEAVIRQAETLTSTGDFVSIHFDARAKAADFARIERALAGNPSVTFARRRRKCGWGEWSLVDATLEAVKAAAGAFPLATHFYMLSGDCMQIKTAEFAHRFLDAEDVDYIESFDFFASDWIKTGIREERLHYRHFFNERTQKKWFYRSLDWQQRLGLSRPVPPGLRVMIGSQWWCLRRETIERVLAFCQDRPDVMRFFRTTWIPDETFFQTIVRHVTPDAQIRTRTLTFLMFTDYGLPVTFYNDHYDLLLSQNYLFARKISPDATVMKERLFDLWARTGVGFRISNEGRALFHFLTGRGRIGRRFAPRFWETESSLGRDRTLMVLVCKKWHVAKRLVAQIRSETAIPAVEYLFSEDSAMPDLGGIERTVAKRNRHRRALLRMLFDYFDSDRLLICVDPADFELLRDFTGDRAVTRVLEIECDFDDAYLIGHARRIGLAAENTPDDVVRPLLTTIRYDLKFESDRMVDADFPMFARMSQQADAARNAAALARFLGVDTEVARRVLSLDYLFAD
ncbi:DUF5928 domain-containing protein [Paenirhodobacter populi]|uniref:DUF5928 domain-containing protein n=1 Tax=Paenirhodobacter populi TaxID=2306993 RepID=UPI000FE34EE3|nr:DUF5928 domain-containing protein [Sinirhodobacter populi]RWR11542.1 glycosyl transferase [Sinirhodobacter populi]